MQRGGTDADCPFILSTIHSSKGLEYERVILMDVADGLLPKALPGPQASKEDLDAYEEERRLFYVGMTRAKRDLSILTFRKPGEDSAFADELFPPEPGTAAVPVPPAQAAASASAARTMAVAPDMSACDTGAHAPVYRPGARVRHKVFGPGTLVSRLGDIAVIDFDSGQTKKLAISVALRVGQLRPET